MNDNSTFGAIIRLLVLIGLVWFLICGATYEDVHYDLKLSADKGLEVRKSVK